MSDRPPVDLPFLPPPDIVIDLPSPPSVNRLWLIGSGSRTRMSVSRSPVYKKWLKEADQLAIATAACRGVKMIAGKFEAIIILKRSMVDLDNNAKGVLDWAQSRNLIENDKHCEKLTLQWGDAPYGCRLILRAIETHSSRPPLRMSHGVVVRANA